MAELTIYGIIGSIFGAIVQRLSRQSEIGHPIDRVTPVATDVGRAGNSLMVESAARLLGQPLSASVILRVFGPGRGPVATYAIAAIVLLILSEDTGPLWSEGLTGAMARVIMLGAVYAVETCTAARVAARHSKKPALALCFLHAMQVLAPALAVETDDAAPDEAAASAARNFAAEPEGS